MLNCPRCGEINDYVPTGGPANNLSNLREPEAFEYYRCGAQTGDDIQSGPIYCGDRASLIANSSQGGIAAACERHSGRLRRIADEEQAERKRRDEQESREAEASLTDGGI